MKHLFFMKTRNIVISALTLLLCTLGATSSYARTFAERENIYINTNTDFNWTNAGANLFLYCFGGSSPAQWFELDQVCGDYYKASMSAGTWNTCIVVRKNSSGTAGNWDNKWNQTGDITIDDSKNYIKYFSNESSSATWDNFPFYYHDGSEELYFSKAPNDWSWFGNDFGSKNYVYAKFFRTSEPYCETWSKASNDRPGLFKVDIPAGIWSHVIFARLGNDSPSDGNIISDPSKDANQSRNLPVFANEIYLNFKQRSTSGGEDYNLLKDLGAKPSADPTTSDDIWGTPRRDIKICAQAIERGDNYTLTPLLNDAKNEYTYSEGMSVWWKWNATAEDWEYATNKWNDVNQVLEDVDDAYYYLWTTMGEKEKYRRFLHLVKDSDCKINCEITSLNYAITPVNVIDSTFGIEGLVAFTKQEGDLVVSYGKNTYRLPTDSMQTFTSPESPQTFSLSGLKADGSTDNHLLVEFTGVGGAKADSLITAPKLETDGVVIHNSKNAPAHYSPSKETYAHDENITLTPHVETLEADSFAWLDAKGNILKAGNKDSKATPYDVSNIWGFDTTLVYYYTEYNIPPESNDNLMGNGYYENTSKEDDDNKDASPYKTISGYKYTGVWGDITGKRDAYYNEYGNETGLFGVTTSADIFWNRFAKISPRKGKYFGVFDGDADGEEKVAWSAETNSTTNKDLKLQKGTTYLFSFWVANVNNAGEMISYGTDGTPVTNNAILQFKISYKYKDENGDEQEETLPLGKETDLNNYLDNFWHQNSATFVSPVDAYHVAISVVDKNKTGISIGNDFALDDIRFRSVSVQSATVRARERFAVKFEEPAPEVRNVTIDTISSPVCENEAFSFITKFEYKTSISHTLSLNIDVTGFGDPITYSNNTLVNTAGEWQEASFVFSTNSGAGVDKQSDLIKAKDSGIMNASVTVSFTDENPDPSMRVTKSATASSSYTEDNIPATPKKEALTGHGDVSIDCDKSSFSVTVNYKYFYFHGTEIYAKWDGTEKHKTSVTQLLKDWTTYSTTLTGIPADGKTHKLLICTNNPADCPSEINVDAPKGNIIKSFSAKHVAPNCDDERYKLQIGWRVGKTADGIYDKLIILDANGDKILATIDTITVDTATAILPQTYKVDSAHVVLKAYLEQRTSSCAKPAADYETPIVPNLTIGTRTIEDTTCNSATYSVKWSIRYVNQRGTMKAWLDDDDTKLGTVTGFVENTSSTATVKFTGLKADGSEHVLHVKCTGERSCERESAKFTAPIRPVLAKVSKSVSTPAFGEITYDVTISADLSNAKGRKLYIKSLDLSLSWDTTLQVVDEAHISHTFKGIATDNDVEHKFRIYFEALPHCGEMVTYNSPDARKLNSMTVGSPSAVSCDGYFTIPFTVQAAEINGTLVVKDGNTTVYSASHDTHSPNSREITGTTDPITADGAEHKLEAYFVSQIYQRGDTFEIFDAPTAPTISATPTASYTIDCEGKVKYTFTINFANQTTDLKLDTAGVNLETYDYATKLAGKSSQEHSLTIPADNKARTVVAYFEGREDAGCKVTINLPAVKKPEWQFKHGVSAHDCNGKYNDTITITWNDAVAGDLKITKPGETTVIESPAKSDGTHTYIVKDLDVDFAGNILRYYFGDRTDCAQEIEATPPTKRSITATHRNFSTITCDGKVNDTIDFVISNPIGNLVLTKENGDPLYTETNVGTNYTYVATNLTAGATLTIKYRLSQGLNCVQTYLQALPPAPTISMTKTAASPSLDCKGIVTRPLVVTFANQTGALVIRDEADKVLDSIPAGDSKLSTGSYVYNWQYSAGTTSHYAYAYFSNRRACATSNVTSDVVIEGQVNTTQKVSVPDCNGVYNDTVFFVWDDNVLGDLVVHNMSDVFVTSTEHAALKHYVVFTGLKVSDGEQKICQFWFSGSSACKDTIIVTPPVLPTITIATESFSKVNCDGKYAVNLQYTITNPMGDLVVTPPVGAAITIQNVGTTGSIYISDLIANGTEQIFQARLTEGLNCTKEHKLTAPATPTLSIAKDGEQSAPNCKGTVTLPIKVTYTNQSSTAYLTLIDDKGDNAIEPILVSELDLSPCAINWNYTADGKEHSVYAYISDRPDCQTDPVRITAPSAPYWEYTRHRSMINCDGNYTDTLRFSWKDASSAFTIDTLDSNGNAITAQRYSNTASTDDVIRLYHGNVADASANIYKVYFAGHAGDCDSIIKNFESGHAPIKPELVINKADTLHGACDDKTYAIAVEWQYKAFAASTMTFNVSGATKSTKRELTYNPEFVNCKDTIKGLPADGASHTLTIKTDVVANCSFEKTDICAPKGNVLTSFKVDTTTLTCTNGNYQLVATWNVEAPAQAYDVLVIVDENDNLLLEETLTSTTLSHTATLPQSYAEGDAATPKTIYAYLKERGKGCAKSDTYSDPVQPTMAIGEVNKTLATNCSDSTYTIVVPVTYKNQHGDMYAWIDTDTRRHKITANEDGTGEAYLADQSAERTTNIKFSNLVADGKQHTIHIACDETQGACAKTKTYDAPFTPVIDSVVVSCNEPAFGATTYDATVKVYYKNASKNGTASSLTIRSTDLGAGQSQRSTTVTVSGDGVYTWEVTGLTAENGATRHFEAFFVDRNTCVFNEEVQTPDTRKLIFSVTPSVVNCDGKDTILFTVNASDLSGNLVIMEGTTELYNQPAPTAYPFHGKIETPVPAGSVHNLYAYFTSDPEFHSSTVTFTALAAPTISMGRTTDSPDVDCNGTVHLPLKVSFENQNGDLVVRDNSHELIDSIPAASLVGLTSTTVNWSYPADNNSTRSAYAYFHNRSACVTPQVASVVKKQASWSYTTHHSAIDCEGYYSDTLRFTWSYANGYFVVDSIDGSNLYYDNSDSGSFTRILTGLRVTDNPTERYIVYFSTRKDDCDSIITTIPQQASVLDTLITYVPKISCGATEYTVELRWEYTMAIDSLYVKDDETGAIIWRGEATDAQPAIVTLPLTTDEPQKQHTFSAHFKDRDDACGKSSTFREASLPQLLSIALDDPTTAISCDAETYTLTGVIRYVHLTDETSMIYLDTCRTSAIPVTGTPVMSGDTATVAFPAGLTAPADGKSHTLHLFIGDGSTGCAISQSFTAVQHPVIQGVRTEQNTAYVNCGDPYNATVIVDVLHADGMKLYVSYTDSLKQRLDSTTIADGSTQGIIPLTGLYDTGGSKPVKVFFEGYEQTCAIDTASIAQPQPNTISSFTAEASRTHCEEVLYTVSGQLSFNNADGLGDLVVYYDDTHRDTIFAPMISPASYSIETMDVEGRDLQLTAYFTQAQKCAVVSELFNSPVVPAFDTLNVRYSHPACGDTLTTLSFDLPYCMQRGTMSILLDDVAVTPAVSGTYVPDKSDYDTLHISLPEMLADGKTHTVSIEFDDPYACEHDFTMPKAPFSPKVLSTDYKITDVACGSDTYTLEVTFTVGNSQNKAATLSLRGTGAAVTANTTDGITYTYTFTDVTRTFDDKDDDFVEVYFADNTDCTTPTRIEYIETPKPVASVENVKVNQPDCDVSTFTIDFELSFIYQHGNVTVWVDDDHKADTTFAISEVNYDLIAAMPFLGQLSGEDLVADGSKGHKLYFRFDGEHACNGESDLFDFPNTPLITGVAVTNVPDYIEGVEGTYNPTVTVTYSRAQGERIVLEYLDKDDEVQTAYSDSTVSGDDTYVFNNLTFDDVTKGDRTVHAYFEGSECTSGKGDGFNHDDEYKAPTNSSIKFESIDLPTNRSTCDKLLYDLTGTVSYVGATIGDLVVEFDADHKDVIPIAECMPGAMLSFAIRGISVAIPDEGKSLTAYFVGAETNFTISDKVYEPDQPSLAIDEVKVDTTFSCGSKRYDITVTVSSANQHGTCYVLDSIAGRVVSKAAIYEGTYNGTYEITINLPATDEQHFVVVRYPATGCEVITSAIDVNPYTKPEPRITLSAIDRLCNTETELQLPFAITQGDIAGATLTLTNSKSETVITAADMSINATRDTLSFSMSSQLAAGKYTATVEARDTLDCSTSATLPVEFALGGVVFSKWTDVLLVDNSDGLFTGYQWYENDNPLPGQTGQVLYIPEGMNEQSLYYCLIQAADGAIYTCESVFADMPRSADNPKPQSSNHITVLPNRVIANGAVTVRQSLDENLRLILMSATGKRVAEYTQTESAQLINMPSVQGIYLLRIESDSDVQTVKIVVY